MAYDFYAQKDGWYTINVRAMVDGNDVTRYTAAVTEKDGKVYLNVTGAKPGSTKVTVSYSGATPTTVNVTVAADTGVLNYDFINGYTAYGSDINEDVEYTQTITYDKTTVGGAEEINKLILSEPWAYFNHTNMYFRYVGIRLFNGFQNAAEGNVNTIKIKVNKAGKYYPCAIFGGFQRMATEAYEALYSEEQIEACHFALPCMEDHVNPHMWLGFTGEAEKEVDDLHQELFTYTREQISKFLLGQLPMSEWDTFQKGLKDMGVDRLLELYTESYNGVIGKN